MKTGVNLQFFQSIKSDESLVQKILIIIGAFLLYFITLIIHPDFLRSLSRFVRYNTIFIAPIFVILFFFIFNIPGWWGRFLGFSISGVFFALTLVGLWSSGLDNYYAVSGIIPWSDARFYYIDALRLFEGGRLSSFSSWHPIFPAFLTTILWLSGQNIQVTVSVLTAIVWVCCYLLAKEVHRTHGSLAGAFVLLILFIYYRQFSGTLVAESLGLSLGCLGFTLLWRGAEQRKKILVLSGLFFVSLALNSRLGTFFILPLLLIWGGRLFRGSNNFSFRFLFSGMGVILCGFCVYFGTMVVLGNAPKSLFPNYASCFYDLSSGYQQWGNALKDHPELVGLSEEEMGRSVYRLAFQNIRTHPIESLKGAARQYAIFFSKDWYSVYSFFETRNTLALIAMNAALYLLCIAGLAGSLIKRDDPGNQLIVYSFVGLFLSIPFVPPELFNRMRLYAATLPVLAILPAVGLVFILRLLNFTFFLKRADQYSSIVNEGWIGYALCFCIIISPLAAKIGHLPAGFQEMACSDGTEAVYVRIMDGNYINVMNDDDLLPNWLPNYHEGRFKRYLHDFSPHYYVMEEFEKVEPPVVILVTLDLKTNQDICVVMNADQLLTSKGVVGMCGRWSDNPKVFEDRFFYTDTVTMVGSP